MKVTAAVDGLGVVSGLVSKKERIVPWDWVVHVRDEFGPTSLNSLMVWYEDPAKPGEKQSLSVSMKLVKEVVLHPNFPRELLLPESVRKLGLDENVARTFGPPGGAVWIENPKAEEDDVDLLKKAVSALPKERLRILMTAYRVAPFDRGVVFPDGQEVVRWRSIQPSRLPAPGGAYWVSLFGEVDSDDFYGYVLTPEQGRALVSHPSAAGWDLPEAVYSALNASRRGRPLRSS